VSRSQVRRDELRFAAGELVEETHPKVVPLAADLTEHGEVKGLAEQAIAALGKIDILINNAGGNVQQPVDQITDEIWNYFVELNPSAKGHLPAFLLTGFKPTRTLPTNPD
jgi:NAD(P)-dependent dehydrogenase (short-subunit alcohol dehydrogenase family)